MKVDNNMVTTLKFVDCYMRKNCADFKEDSHKTLEDIIEVLKHKVKVNRK